MRKLSWVCLSNWAQMGRKRTKTSENDRKTGLGCTFERPIHCSWRPNYCSSGMCGFRGGHAFRGAHIFQDGHGSRSCMHLKAARISRERHASRSDTNLEAMHESRDNARILSKCADFEALARGARPCKCARWHAARGKQAGGAE